MLVLFDIDGTLLLTRRAGARSMQEAGRRLFGERFDLSSVEMAGRLDPVIFADAMRLAGLVADEDAQRRFRAAYAEGLARRLAESGTAYALAGVLDLLSALERVDGVAVGLVTGNYPETGKMKLDAAGIGAARFSVAAWGEDGPTRRDLPRVAMERHGRGTGRRVEPHRTVVIGDTPHDVDCARAHGCLAVAVASGPAYARVALEPHAPDLLLDDLSDVDGLLAWLAAVPGGARATDPAHGG